jgi:hypothetical protein
MSWKTEITLTNNRNEDVLCLIPKGLIFENKRIGTSVQNVAASRDYQLVIPALSTLKVDVEVLCINRSFSPPNGQLANVTIFKIDRPFKTQDELWQALSTP